MAKGCWISCDRSISNPEALAAYAKLAGPAYQAALKVLGNAVERDFRIVEGAG